MAPRTYPTLPEGLDTRLGAVELAILNNPDFFDSPACPYSDKLKDYLKRLCASQTLRTERLFSDAKDADKFDLALREIEITIDEMASIERSLEKAEAGDRIQFVKAKTTLVEKWVTIKEKIFNIREISEFQSIIIRQMDEVMTVDQRKQFLDALRSLRTTAKVVDGMN